MADRVNTGMDQTKPRDATVTELISARHSTRGFLPQPVPHDALEECLSLAQRAPSNSNIQPWRLTIVTGSALQRLEKGLLAAVKANIPPQIAPIPREYHSYRSQVGHGLYGENGYNIRRDAKDQMEAARLRNYSFFDSPMGIMLCMDSALASVDVLSVGLYLQTLCLPLQERGLGSCIQVSVAGYPDVIRRELGIGADMHVLCGVAIGYEDPSQRLNSLRMGRDEWDRNVRFVSE